MKYKKTIIALIAAISYLATSCTTNDINIEGEIEGYNLNGEIAYLYFYTTGTDIDPIFLAETSISNNKFSFKELEKLEVLQGKNLPTIALITLKDRYIQDMEGSASPLASLILEQGTIKVVFKDTAVEVSGTSRNKEFNKMQLAVTNIANFAEKSIEAGNISLLPTDDEGRDGAAQYQNLVTIYKEANYNFTKSNMSNTVGEFLFNGHAEKMFTPAQVKELIGLGSEAFKAIPEIKQLAEMLSQMDLQERNSSFDIRIEPLGQDTTSETKLLQDSFDIVLEE